MGEMAEYILNGDDCQECGAYIGSGDGFPRSCASCRPSKSQQKRFASLRSPPPLKEPCTICGKRFSAIGLKDHMRDKHEQPANGRESGG